METPDPAYRVPPTNLKPEWTPPPKRPGMGCLPGIAIGCFASLALLIGGCSLFSAAAYMMVDKTIEVNGCSITGASVSYTSIRGEGPNNVLRLELTGPITGETTGGWFHSPTSDAIVLQEIKDATKEDFKALLLVLNSPGGGVTPSDEIYRALENFKAAQPDRKVIVLGKDVVASGAYYLAMQADWIRLQPTSITGSIGVIMPNVNLSELAKKIGLADASIASGNSKDIGNPLKPVNPQHTAILKTVVDGMYNRFVSIVAKGRHMTEEEVRKLADGRVYLAQDAVNLRLADDIGYEDSIDDLIAKQLDCAVGDLRIYEPSVVNNPFAAFISELPSAVGRGIAAPLVEQHPATPQYQW